MSDRVGGMDEYQLKLEYLGLLLPRILYGSSGYVYLQGEYPWTQHSLGLLFYVYGDDRYDLTPLETQFPDFASFNGLQQVMQIGRAEDALQNAYMQRAAMGRSGLSMKDAVACFNHHYKYDGFLELK